MKKNFLWNTWLEVTELCLGTMTWGNQNTEIEAHEQLDYAIKEAGINFLDTAEVYPIAPSEETQGLTETYIWTWLAKNAELRSDIIIASKMVWPGLPWMRWGTGIIPSKMEEAVNGSLQRLQTDYIDLYQIHWPQRAVNKFGKMNYDEEMVTDKTEEEEHILEVLRAFEALRKQGKVKFLWLSNETSWWTMKFLEIARKHNLPEVQTIQNPYSIVQRQFDASLTEVSVYENIGLLAYAPLAWWVLTWKYRGWLLPKGSRFAEWGKERYGQYWNERVFESVEQLGKIADEAWLNLTQISLAWVNSKKFVHSNIIWATTVDQLKEDIASTEIILKEDTMKQIDALFTNIPNGATY